MERGHKITAAISDVSDLFRKSLAKMLRHNNIDIVGTVANDDDLCDLLKTHRTDVVIYDLINSSSRFDFTMQRIRDISPDTKLLVLSFEDYPELIQMCLKSGAKGFCDKNIPNVYSLLDAITKINKGEIVVH